MMFFGTRAGKRARRGGREQGNGLWRAVANEISHVRVPAETELGRGFIWLELLGDMPVRQVEWYGERWFSSRSDHHPELGSALLSNAELLRRLGSVSVIDEVEFERIWQASADTQWPTPTSIALTTSINTATTR